MGTLRDEAYEKLDYLSQLTEIVVSPHNEVLGRLPDKLDVTFDMIRSLKYKLWGSSVSFELSLHTVLRSLLSFEEEQYLQTIADHFQLQASEDFEIDFSNKTMTGSICLVKLNPQIEEKKLLEIAVNDAQRELNSYSWPNKKLRERVITVLNTLEPGYGTTWAQNVSQRISYTGATEIKKLLANVIMENKWRIRDAKTIVKVGQWIDSYLNGNDVGLMNLLKLKIMVDKDLPIYSVDEVKNANPAGTP